MRTAYFIIIALMISIAILFPEWNGIFIAEGILLGIGLALAGEIKKKGKKE